MRASTSRILLTAALILLLGGPVLAGPGQAAGAHHHHRHATHRQDASAAHVLRLVNQARSTARTCGGHRYRAVRPLRNDARLDRAAGLFALLMGRLHFFDHVGPNHSTPGSRLVAQGYHWHSYGENIGAGFPTAKAMVDAWLTSPDHCRNIMTSFHDVGIGVARVPGSPYGVYWVIDFGSH